jgi:erythromycin esterase-like protein
MAGKRWGAPMEEMLLPPGRPGTWEDICHRAGKGQNMLLLPEVLQDPIFEKRVGHRAVGVVYNPHRDVGNYVPSVMKNRYDAFMFLDTTKAVHALKDVQVDMHEMPETYPWGV